MIPSDDEHPLLNDPSLVALILRSAQAPTDPAELAARLADLLATAREPAPPPGIEARLALLCDDLAAAGLLRRDYGRYRLTPEGARARDEHPGGLDRADLANWPGYAAQLADPIDAAGSPEDPHADAYDRGAAARLAGRPVTDNPYPADSADHGAWEDGWSNGEGD